MNYPTAFYWGGKWRGKHCSGYRVSVCMCWGGVRGHWLMSGMEKRQELEDWRKWYNLSILLFWKNSPEFLLSSYYTSFWYPMCGFLPHMKQFCDPLRVLQFKFRSHRLRAQSKNVSHQSLFFWLTGYESEVPMTPSSGSVNLLGQVTHLTYYITGLL